MEIRPVDLDHVVVTFEVTKTLWEEQAEPAATLFPPLIALFVLLCGLFFATLSGEGCPLFMALLGALGVLMLGRDPRKQPIRASRPVQLELHGSKIRVDGRNAISVEVHASHLVVDGETLALIRVLSPAEHDEVRTMFQQWRGLQHRQGSAHSVPPELAALRQASQQAHEDRRR